MADYRAYLRREFDRRLRKNPSYSLRAFARDIEILPSKLSEVFSGRCGLSVSSASRLAGHIGLSETETKLFVCLVEVEHGRSALTRQNAKRTLEHLQAKEDYGSLDLEKFKIISDWYHMALLELAELEEFRPDPLWIAQRLGIDASAAESALQRLIDFGLLKRTEEGRFVQTSQHLATPGGIPSREVREHHSQILGKADQALDSVPVAQREFSSTTLAISAESLEEAREMIISFRRRFAKRVQKPQKKNRVYCFSMQFFPLDQENAG